MSFIDFQHFPIRVSSVLIRGWNPFLPRVRDHFLASSPRPARRSRGGDDRIVVRGIGSSLAPGSFPASAVLADPTLELRDT
jgi:hypothetical protein